MRAPRVRCVWVVGQWLPWFLVALLGLGSVTRTRADDVRATAQVMPPRVAVGESAVLTVTISGAQDVPVPNVPAVAGVRVEYLGPATQVVFAHGQVRATVEHRYSVVAERAGTYRLGPFAFLYGGWKYEADAVALEVVAAAAASSSDNALRLVVRVPRTRVYLREKLPVDVLLYVGPVRAGDLQYPTLPADGCSLEPFQEPAQYQDTIDGQVYTVVRFRSAVTPLRTGALTLGPASTRLNVYERRRGGFFDDPFFSQRRQVAVHSEAVRLEVLPLPEDGKPATFSGAVGNFALRVEANPTEVRTGDPVTLRIVLQGHGNLDGVLPPSLPAQPHWKVYEARPVESRDGTTVFEQVVIPTQVVSAVPPLEFSFFDPEAERYRIVRSDAVGIAVRHAEETPAAIAAPAQSREESLGRDIVYLKEHPGRWEPFAGTSVRVLAAVHGGLLLFPVAAFLWDRRRQQREADREYARQRRASRVAQRALAECRALAQSGTGRELYDRIAAHVREYLAARFDLPPGAVDIEALQRLPVAEDVRRDFLFVLRACEAARFGGEAPTRGGDDVVRTLERALRAQSGRTSSRWRPRWIAVLAVLYPGTLIATESPDALFYRGNAAYAARDYRGAIAAYEVVLPQRVGSAALFFNLGNAYVKIGDLGRAALNYERALWFAPRDPDVRANLEFARNAAGASGCEPPLWVRFAFPWVTTASPRALHQAALLAFFVAAAAATAMFVQRTAGLWWRRVALVGALVWSSLVTSALAKSTWLSWSHYGVAVEGVAARFAPEEGATPHFTLAPATRVRVHEQRGDWRAVERCDGRRGWVPARSVVPIAP